MSERNEKSKAFTIFSFICPKGREEEVKELFNKSEQVSLSPDFQEGTRLYADPNTGITAAVEGIEIHGVTDIANAPKITKHLSERGIAGYSETTQVIFHPMDDSD